MSTGRPWRIGWIVDSAPRRAYSLPWQSLGPVGQIRYGNVARHIAATDGRFAIERCLPWRRYDALVVVKKLNEPTLELALRFQARGVPVIFDSNVNYYERWGHYEIPGTEPRPEQMELAQAMTRLANVVVADSTYLAEQCRRFNSNVVMIPDAVDTELYRPGVHLEQAEVLRPLRVVWSGISKKAHHLQFVEEVLRRLSSRLDVRLVINRPHPADPPSAVIQRLTALEHCRVSYFSYDRYVHDLRESDVIISPKILSSAYEMAHTEYRITLGMAVGLPALASPQPSYVEALADDGGGWICSEPKEWEERLMELQIDALRRREAGVKARRRVIERYAVPVVAERYKRALLAALREGELLSA